MRRIRNVGIVAVGGALGVAIFTGIAYAADMGSHHGEVGRGVRLAGEKVDGLGRSHLRQRVADLAESYAAARVRVDAPGGGFTASAKELGLVVNSDATVETALRVGRGGTLPGRVFTWLRSFIGTRRAPVVVNVDRDAVYRTVAAKDEGPRREAVEPTFKLVGDEFEPVDGKNGRGIDPDDVVDAVTDAARRGLPLRVEVERGTVEPRITRAEVERLAREANELVTTPLPVTAGGSSTSIPPRTLKSWLRPTVTGLTVELAIDPKAATDGIARLLPRAGSAAVQTRFRVSGGSVVIVPGRAGTGCCAPETPDLILQAIRQRRQEPLALPLKTIEPRFTADEARALGINQIVGSFTTRHPAGQPRVANIHRIADLVRGHVIEPGGTFSVNGFVGRRTTARGFVNAPVIEDGIFAESVGGGVSQFATTLFNAAFFAGLELREYQSHSIYLTRYPYGREATLNYPKPDLVIRNPTPYGILIWPTYSSSAISVNLYSTKFFDVVQSGQSESPNGVCKRVKTERTRTRRTDGRRLVDAVYAVYRPAEGRNCDGTVNPKASTTTTTTAKPPPTTAPPPPSTTAPPPATTATSPPPPPPP